MTSPNDITKSSPFSDSENHAFYKALLDGMVTFVAVLDRTGTILFVNNTPLKAVGITLADIKGTKFWDAAWWAYSQDAVDNIRADVDLCLTGESLLHEIQLATADGTLIWIEYGMHPIFDKDGQVEYLVPEGRDITKLQIEREQLQQLAHYDIVTKLPNRALFADRFNMAIAHSKRTKTLLAVCFLDLDNFKPINDNFGHDIGDLLLIEVSKRISDIIRDEDTVSRQGGDEFTLLLGNLATDQQCKETIKRVLSVFSKPFVINGYSHPMSASCGITLYPTDTADALDTLLRHADQAMYKAKTGGKARCSFFDAETEKESLQQVDFNQHVAQAINDQEMVLYYQPKVNIQQGEMHAVEALIRWKHPQKGLIAPAGFLPKIENTQAMIQLGKWVMDEAVQQLDAWHKQGKTWGISINIDAYHFMEAGFYPYLEQTLARYPDTPASLLQIEILETVEFKDLQVVSKLIKRCQSLGVSFALDDFGTGYSSLTYLKDLPAEWLKIDQSFIRDMLDDEQDLALIEGIISLAKAFKRDVIAEGVETNEHAKKLLDMGCLNVQGYGIAKPMPADEVIPWEANYQSSKAWEAYS